MNKVLVIGAGAMGCRFGAAFFRAGLDVCLYDVAKAHVDAIRARGLLVHTADGVETLPIPATDCAESLSAPDIAVLFTKTMYTRAALDTVGGCFGADTVLLTLQNGLGNVEKIAEHIPRERILAGVTTHTSELLGPGEIKAAGSGLTRLMPLAEAGRAAAERIVQILNAQGMDAEVSADVMRDIWEKVAFNAAFNTVAAVSLLSVDQIGRSDFGRRLVRDISAEVARVAASQGVRAQKEHIWEMLDMAMTPGGSGSHKPSMLQDRLAGRPSEIESICGEALRIAAAAGIDTPALRTVYRMVKMIEAASPAAAKCPQ